MKRLFTVLCSAMLLTSCSHHPSKSEKIDCNNLQAAFKGKTKAEQQAIGDKCFLKVHYVKSDPGNWSVN